MEKVNKTAVMEMALSILQPLSKILILSRLSHTEVTKLVRKSLVSTAYESFKTPGKNMTYSTVSLLTGLNRKEVVRQFQHLVRDGSKSHQRQSLLTSQATRLIRAWNSDEDYLNEEGEPKDIPLNSAPISFESLSKKYCRDIDPKFVLKELLRLELIESTNGESIKFIGHDHLKIHEMLEDVRLMSCAMSDLFGDASKGSADSHGDISYSKKIIFSGINEHIAKEFHDTAVDKATELFNLLHKIVTEDRERQGLPARKNCLKVGLGIYYFDDEQEPKIVKVQSEDTE